MALDMTPEDFAKIADAFAWPLTVIVLAAGFYKPIRTLFDRLGTALAIRAVKLKLFGQEIELTPEQAKGALAELLEVMAESTSGLSSEDLALFEKIRAAEGRATVDQLIDGYQREDASGHPTPGLQRLRKLRDRHLTRPFEGGNWKSDKHPMATRFGQLVDDLRKRKATATAV